jgi:hypothetical protein
MTRQDDFIDQLEGFLDEFEGNTPLPGEVRDAIRAQIPSIQQRPAWWPARRFPSMNNTAKFSVAAAVVAVAALLGFNYLVAPNIGSPGLGDPTPSLTPIPTPTPAVFDEQPEGEVVAPGSYLITEVEPFRITVTVPDGWQNVRVPGLLWGEGVVLGFWYVDNVFVDPCASDLGLLDPAVGPTVDDLATAFGNVPGLEATSPTDVTVDGFAGKQMELTATAAWDGCFGNEAVLWPIDGGPDAKPPPDPGDLERLWILDVNGDRLVISSTVTPDASDEVQGELEAIFASVQIEAP